MKNLEFLIVRYFTLLGNIAPQFSVCVLIALFVDFRKGLEITLLWGLAYAMNLIIKNTVRKARPDVVLRKIKVKGYSFASGHSVTSLVLYFSIARYFWNELLNYPLILIFILALPFLLGLSRLYLRVHFLEDVVGGWIIGYMYLCLASDYLLERYAMIISRLGF